MWTVAPRDRGFVKISFSETRVDDKDGDEYSETISLTLGADELREFVSEIEAKVTESNKKQTDAIRKKIETKREEIGKLEAELFRFENDPLGRGQR